MGQANSVQNAQFSRGLGKDSQPTQSPSFPDCKEMESIEKGIKQRKIQWL